MTDAILYMVLVVGCGLLVYGNLVVRWPDAFFKEEAKQVMWVALGGYMMLFGAVVMSFSAYFLWG